MEASTSTEETTPNTDLDTEQLDISASPETNETKSIDSKKAANIADLFREITGFIHVNEEDSLYVKDKIRIILEECNSTEGKELVGDVLAQCVLKTPDFLNSSLTYTDAQNILDIFKDADLKKYFHVGILNNIFGSPDLDDDSPFEKRLIDILGDGEGQEVEETEFKSLLKDVVVNLDDQQRNRFLNNIAESVTNISKNILWNLPTDEIGFNKLLTKLKRSEIFEAFNKKNDFTLFRNYVYKNVTVAFFNDGKVIPESWARTAQYHVRKSKDSSELLKNIFKDCFYSNFKDEDFDQSALYIEFKLNRWSEQFSNLFAAGTFFHAYKKEAMDMAKDALDELFNESSAMPEKQAYLAKLGIEIADQVKWKFGEYFESGLERSRSNLINQSLNQLLQVSTQIENKEACLEIVGSHLNDVRLEERGQCIALFAKKIQELGFNIKKQYQSNLSSFPQITPLSDIQSALKSLGKYVQITVLQKIATGYSLTDDNVPANIILKECSSHFNTPQKLRIARHFLESKLENIITDGNLEERLKEIKQFYLHIGYKGINSNTNEFDKATKNYIGEKIIKALDKADINNCVPTAIVENIKAIHEILCNDGYSNETLLSTLAKKEAEFIRQFPNEASSLTKNVLECVEGLKHIFFDNSLGQNTLCDVVNTMYEANGFKDLIDNFTIQKIYDLTRRFEIVGDQKINIFLNLAESKNSIINKKFLFFNRHVNFLKEIYEDILFSDNESLKQRFVAMALKNNNNGMAFDVLSTFKVSDNNLRYLTNLYNDHNLSINNPRGKRILGSSIMEMSETDILSDKNAVCAALKDIVNYERSRAGRFAHGISYIPFVRLFTSYGHAADVARTFIQQNGIKAENFFEDNDIFLSSRLWNGTKSVAKISAYFIGGAFVNGWNWITRRNKKEEPGFENI